MYNPISTYRIQFHKDFTFKHLDEIIPYLKKLGVHTIYASPIFESVPGSLHGYDVLNSNRINPEIGTEEELFDLSKKLKKNNIGWLQDIVPNHMAFDPRNPWLFDVLEKGKLSEYASFFDIDWAQINSGKQLMVPFLGTSLEDCIHKKELSLVYTEGRLFFKHSSNYYPLHPQSYKMVCEASKAEIPILLKQWIEEINVLKSLLEKKNYSDNWNQLLEKFSLLMDENLIQNYIQECLESINNNKEVLQQILIQQAYRLCHWQETDHHINYRRFFTVNGLICLNMQDPQVFQHYHQYIFSLVSKGIFQGLRVDHVDGLYDPTKYLKELRKHAGEDTYIIVEKILEKQESLLLDWPVQGTTGYEYLAAVNNLLTNKEAGKDFAQFYDNQVDHHKNVAQQAWDKKAHILYHHMGGELENFYQIFIQLVQPADFANMRSEDIKTAIAEFLIHCPVYRYYFNDYPFSPNEKESLRQILNEIKLARPDITTAVNLLENTLLDNEHYQTEQSENVLHFFKRCMQFSGPLMAKGIEDTLMYTYNRFIAHNEVGDATDAFGISDHDFNRQMKDRQLNWPLTLNTTSTHDTKRGEDVRARLNVLSDLPLEWFEKVREWQQINKELKKENEPDANDEYFIYQVIIGSYPLQEEDENDYTSRLKEYLQKALREGKRKSNWSEPNIVYEKAVTTFAVELLDKNKPFWQSFFPFLLKIANHGIVNSLIQTILKFTCPGVPDVYQGSEFWDLSFVDPDNRRPVDFEKRHLALDVILNDKNTANNLSILWKAKKNAHIKLFLIQRLLNLRLQQPALFSQGKFVSISIKGKYKENIFAFARILKQSCIIVAVPLHSAQIGNDQNVEIENIDWNDTCLELPNDVHSDLQNVLTGQKHTTGKKIFIKEIFKNIPFAILQTVVNENKRSAGILLHISSLPSEFGIGDLGKDAYAFADFLYESNQKYWQLLPINPTEGGQGHSPYSATSSMAGNTLFISPRLLQEINLLSASDLNNYQLASEEKVNFSEAESVRKELFERAWIAFNNSEETNLKHSFGKFCDDEKSWLDDFALYTILKQQQGGKPWYHWAKEYKHHNKESLAIFLSQHHNEIEKTKWLQFIFLDQWNRLKKYCNNKGILLIGDLPFYVGYDSADVWANQEIFSLDAEGKRQGIAGVPPDDFSQDGQLWGMPVFRWDKLKSQNYDWWIERLKKNKKLFDLLRLDHFRAFADYWEVPENALTAKEGTWKNGPGTDFFVKVKDALGSLPFLAEDLGEIDDKVYDLKDKFELPGMKVLQFGFGEEFETSEHMPHNYGTNFFAYTGTHDNCTVRGWYKNEAGENVRQQINNYLAKEVKEEEIAEHFCRMALGSVAKTAIIPIQDLLNLDESSRMNTPSSTEGNWGWRLLPGQITQEAKRRLKKWTNIYNRD